MIPERLNDFDIKEQIEPVVNRQVNQYCLTNRVQFSYPACIALDLVHDRVDFCGADILSKMDLNKGIDL